MCIFVYSVALSITYYITQQKFEQTDKKNVIALLLFRVCFAKKHNSSRKK